MNTFGTENYIIIMEEFIWRLMLVSIRLMLISIRLMQFNDRLLAFKTVLIDFIKYRTHL